MNKPDFIKKVAEEAYMSEKEVQQVFNTAMEVLEKAMKNKDEVKLQGFGNFFVKDIPAKKARNPQTGESVITSPKSVVAFKISKALRDIVN